MNKLIIFLGICSAFASGSKLLEPDEECEKIVGCYYLNGPAPIEPEDMLSIENIGVSLCTHIYSKSVGINADASVEIDNPDDDIDDFKNFNDLRKKNKNLKTLVSMGGLPDNCENLIKVGIDPILREKLVDNVVDFVKKYEFNGIELDMGDDIQNNELIASNQQDFVLLLKALREKFDEEGLILLATVGNSEAIDKIYDIKGVIKYVNFINLKTFDFHNSNSADMKVGHNAPLYPSSKENAEERKLNIDYIVKYWLSQGAPPCKIILGTAFYGSSYTLANPKLIGRGAPFSGEGEIKGISAASACYEICSLEKNPQWKHLYDEEQQVPYIYNGNQIIAYDNVKSIKKKAEYALKMKLGGVMVWGVEQDDFSGKCGEKFPLLKTLNQVLRNK